MRTRLVSGPAQTVDRIPLAVIAALACGSIMGCQADGGREYVDYHAGNPVISGWYADPDASVIGDHYWIFPTYSAPYDKQTFIDGFSSRDLVYWTPHEHVLEKQFVPWATK